MQHPRIKPGNGIFSFGECGGGIENLGFAKFPVLAVGMGTWRPWCTAGALWIGCSGGGISRGDPIGAWCTH